MIELKISPLKYFELLKKGYSLDMIYLLKLLDAEYIIEELISNDDSKTLSLKLAAIQESIIRKELVTQEGKLTISGKEILDFISLHDITKIKKRDKTDEFDKWWKEFPSSDTFEYKGKKFVGSRALKAKKEDCRAKIAKIINEGEITMEELIEAIKLEVSQKKEESYKTGQNKLKYIQNSSTYLNQRSFEGYVELVKAGHKIEESKNTYNGVEI